jgi:hypothetical protein
VGTSEDCDDCDDGRTRTGGRASRDPMYVTTKHSSHKTTISILYAVTSSPAGNVDSHQSIAVTHWISCIIQYLMLGSVTRLHFD